MTPWPIISSSERGSYSAQEAQGTRKSGERRIAAGRATFERRRLRESLPSQPYAAVLSRNTFQVALCRAMECEDSLLGNDPVRGTRWLDRNWGVGRAAS